MRPPREDTLPWYKQFWPWFLISLPLSVVIASIVTINIAITTNDGLVSVRDRSAVSLDQRRNLESVVADENRDRSAVYREIAVANGRPEWQEEIQQTWAREWQRNARPGWYYQAPDGSWLSADAVAAWQSGDPELALRILADQVDPGSEGGDHDFDIIAVLADHFADREQDAPKVIGIGLVALVDDLVLGLVVEMGVCVVGLCLLQREQPAGGTQPL